MRCFSCGCGIYSINSPPLNLHGSRPSASLSVYTAFEIPSQYHTITTGHTYEPSLDQVKSSTYFRPKFPSSAFSLQPPIGIVTRSTSTRQVFPSIAVSLSSPPPSYAFPFFHRRILCTSFALSARKFKLNFDILGSPFSWLHTGLACT